MNVSDGKRVRGHTRAEIVRNRYCSKIRSMVSRFYIRCEEQEPESFVEFHFFLESRASSNTARLANRHSDRETPRDQHTEGTRHRASPLCVQRTRTSGITGSPRVSRRAARSLFLLHPASSIARPLVLFNLHTQTNHVCDFITLN